MEKITKNAFISALENHKSAFICNAHALPDDILEGRLFDLEIPAGGGAIRKRTATARATFILFSDGSRLGFDQKGKYEFMRLVGKFGAEYVMLKHTSILCDGEPWTKWTIYVVE